MNYKRVLTSSFGLGFLPIAPGTWGSLPPAAIFVVLTWFGLGCVPISVVMAVIAIAASVVCVKFAPAAIKITGKNDPGEVVADEVAGQAVTFIGACAVGFQGGLIVAVLGFLIFRFFDILKPWPVYKLEKFPEGWGILLDDLGAGVYAAIVLYFALRFLNIG